MTTCCQTRVYIHLLILCSPLWYTVSRRYNGLGFVWILSAAGGSGAGQRRQRLAQDFLTWMDQTGDFLSLAERQEVDPIKQERLEVRGHRDHQRQCPWRVFCGDLLISVSPYLSAFRASDPEYGPGSVRRVLRKSAAQLWWVYPWTLIF